MGKEQMNLKPIIMILVLVVMLFVILLVITPMVNEKADTAQTKLVEAESKSSILNEKEETYLLKLGAVSSKETVKKEREEELKLRAEELGIDTSKRYLDSDNKNIFFLLSSIADTLNMDVAELNIYETQAIVPLEDGEESPEPPVEEEPVEGAEGDAELPEGAVPEGEEEPVKPRIPEGHKEIDVKQVSLSLYGDYVDIMLYFQMLEKMSDNFELVELGVSPLVLGNGVPALDYQLQPNEHGFILGNTMNVTNTLDLFYYENKLIENQILAEEKARLEKEAAEGRVKERKDKFSSLTDRYSSSESAVTELARYYGSPEKYDVPVPYILAIADVESGFDASAVGINDNGTKDRGLMQINSGTVQGLMRILGIDYVEGIEHIPALNIELGTLYLKSIADSKGINLHNATDIQKHYIFSAYNKGVAGLETFSLNNSDYKITPYETIYSRNALTKYNEYTLYDDEGEIEKVSYTADVIKYKEDLAAIYNSDREIEEEEEIEIINYTEVTSVKAKFNVKNLGSDTLLLENIRFKFDRENTKDSPVSFDKLTQSEITNIGNNGNGTSTFIAEKASKKEIDAEVERAKLVIRNRIANGLSIENQLNYLKTLTVNDMKR